MTETGHTKRAVSALSSSAPALKTWTGANDTYKW